MASRLRVVLGDQLCHDISSLSGIDPKSDVILMCEVWDEATYVKHHKKKIAFIFSAMRHFAEELRQKGYSVIYTTLDDPNNAGSFTGEVLRAQVQNQIKEIIVTYPSEYRVLKMFQSLQGALKIPLDIRPDSRFLCQPEEFKAWARDKKTLRMEFFYREMRKKYNILMESDTPVGGEWNYDSDNRKALPKSEGVPLSYQIAPDTITKEVMRLVNKRFQDHFGDLEPFYFAVTRADALKVLERFIRERLPKFGDYQDAMKQGEPWMFHAHISFYLNCGLLTPLEVVQQAEAAYQAGAVALNAVEGFIRQIIGWREYVRGIYWLKMPDYAEANFFAANRKLPEFFWTAETKMNCLKQCITETKQNAYAHHIQRLMVLGNFALLAGLSPTEVNEWYLIVYADAYEWVELPNVSGMILYADGGFLASKPYAASGSYINKMSDYCKGCQYSVTEKNGEKACPFNYLYWDFLLRHQQKLSRNQRLSMIYATLNKMPPEKIELIKQDSTRFLSEI